MPFDSRVVPGNVPASPGRCSRATLASHGTDSVEALPLSRSGPVQFWSAVALVAVVLSGLIVTVAAGQGFGPVTESRQGVWFGGSLGQGHADLSCGICGGDQATGGISGNLRIGGTLSPRLLLGGELTGWQQNGEIHQTVLVGTLAGTWYPVEEHGWLLKLGLGLSRYRATEESEALNAWLPTLQIGGGYEMRVSPSISIAPFVGIMASAQGAMNHEVTSNGSFRAERVADDVRLLVLSLGVGITRH